ncbi:MFS transporter [Yinghuangia sp. KLBMP8922]|uniref:MFS transporter n=2 Tax=Yinghuangia soli TaxID=2908204 RepID=A0AA41PUM3_9ACTN|nr:MFS transporter [Yinghuangia soli]MCF2525620.1 MFS transporter [Yinghuangia soli]
MVSMVTDVSSEMVTAILPVYLVLGLGLSPLAFGMLDGLYNGATAFLRIAGGHVADRTRRHKPVAGFGYGLSAACKLALPAAGSVPVIGAVIAADRMGKGVRTAPRDALISLSSPPGGQGRAFGVHRAFDTAGALLGPPVALAVLWFTAQAYDAVFVVSFCLAAFGVLLLCLYVREVPCALPVSAPRPRLREALAVLRVPAFARLCGYALVLGAVTIGDGMVYLLLQREVDLRPHLFPLLPFGTALGFLLLAVPVGLAADRIGRLRVFLCGHVVLLGCYAVLLAPLPRAVLICAPLLLLGVFYAATDGVLMAVAAPLAPARLRGGSLALVQTGQAAGRAVGAIGFGAAWTAWGPHTALIAAAAALATAGGAAAAVAYRCRAAAPPHSERSEHPKHSEHRPHSPQPPSEDAR